MNVIMTYISCSGTFVLYPEEFSRSSDFALYFEEYLTYKDHTNGL